MRIIVSDSSALIDLKKGGLLEALLSLPFEFVIPAALLDAELLSFAKGEIALLQKQMTAATLDGTGMDRAQAVLAASPALSTYDCIAFIVAEDHPGCIMLTGDKRLREKAEAAGMECHGVLWVVDELARARLTTAKTLLRALLAWQDDSTVQLPLRELEAMIARFKR